MVGVGAAARVVGGTVGAVVTAGALVVARAWGAVVVDAGLVEAGAVDVELAVTAVVVGAAVLIVVATSAPELPPVVPVRVLLALLPHAVRVRASPITTTTGNP